MPRILTTQDISWFLDLYEKNQLDLDPPYQRRSVWSPRDRRFFIDTVLNNYPAPPVFLHKSLNEQGRATYHVVDGKQRLQTIIDFTKDMVRIPDDFSKATLQKKLWSDLERQVREQFWNYPLSVEMLPDVSDSYVRNIFERINRNSRKLMNQEMRHAKYDGWFIRVAESETEKQEWKDFGLSTAARMKRMADVQFVSELLRIVIRGKIEGFDQDALDDLYAEYEDLSDNSTFVEDDFLSEVERVKAYIRAVLDSNPLIKDYLKVQAHFYTLWAYVFLERNRLLTHSEFIERYLRFLKDVDASLSGNGIDSVKGVSAYDNAVTDYAKNIRGASTDLTPRAKRYSAIVQALHGAAGSAHEDN